MLPRRPLLDSLKPSLGGDRTLQIPAVRGAFDKLATRGVHEPGGRAREKKVCIRASEELEQDRRRGPALKSQGSAAARVPPRGCPRLSFARYGMLRRASRVLAARKLILMADNCSDRGPVEGQRKTLCIRLQEVRLRNANEGVCFRCRSRRDVQSCLHQTNVCAACLRDAALAFTLSLSRSVRKRPRRIGSLRARGYRLTPRCHCQLCSTGAGAGPPGRGSARGPR